MKRNKEVCIIHDGIRISLNEEAYTAFMQLKDDLIVVKHEKNMLEAELKSIKPILESKNYRPALSKDCGECKYCVRSNWNGDIIGCRKENVCEDFEQKENP